METMQGIVAFVAVLAISVAIWWLIEQALDKQRAGTRRAELVAAPRRMSPLGDRKRGHSARRAQALGDQHIGSRRIHLFCNKTHSHPY